MGVSFSAIDITRTRTLPTSSGAVELPVRVGLPDELGIHLCNGNARLLLGLLSEAVAIDVDPEAGELSLSVARRALMAARARFDALAPHHVRADHIEYGPARHETDGTLTLRPIRAHVFGADVSYLARRLDDLAAFVEAAAVAGATHITWA